jgi:hypothetical protein
MRHRAGGGHAGHAGTGTGLRTTMMGEFERREGKGVVVAVGSGEDRKWCMEVAGFKARCRKTVVRCGWCVPLV